MSKIIRTVRLRGDVVTLGTAERELPDEPEEQTLASVGLATLIDEQVAQGRKEIEAEWEGKMRREMEYLQSEADKRMAEAAAERTTTVLRDSNPVKCSAVKPTCCGRSSRTPPSCY